MLRSDKHGLLARFILLAVLALLDCAVLYYILDTAPHAHPNPIANFVIYKLGRWALLLLKFCTMGGFLYCVAKLHEHWPRLSEAILEFALIVQFSIVVISLIRYSKILRDF
jgi:hypothetical protein